jgi:hypothetical protein
MTMSDLFDEREFDEWQRQWRARRDDRPYSGDFKKPTDHERTEEHS